MLAAVVTGVLAASSGHTLLALGLQVFDHLFFEDHFNDGLDASADAALDFFVRQTRF